MPKKPGETSWDSDDDEDLLSDYKHDESGGAGDTEIDENILEMSDAEIELMPPETTTVDYGGAGDALADHGYVSEPVTETPETDDIMIDENGEAYQVVYTDGDTVLEGEEVALGTVYDEEGNEINTTDQYVMVDEEGNLIQIVEEEQATARQDDTAPDQAMEEGESISVIGGTVAMETNAEHESEMESDEPSASYDDDDEEEEKRRSDRFTSERNDDVISANKRQKKDIPDKLIVPVDARHRLGRPAPSRGFRPSRPPDTGRPQIASMNYIGTPMRPAVPARGRKILINPHFRPRVAQVGPPMSAPMQMVPQGAPVRMGPLGAPMARVGPPMVPMVAWDPSRQPVPQPQPQPQRGPMMPPGWRPPGPNMPPGVPMGPPQPMMPPRPMGPPQMGPRFPQPLMGAPLRAPFPGPPRMMMQGPPGFRGPPQPGPQMAPPQYQQPRPMMGHPMQGPPRPGPSQGFQGPPLQQQRPQGPPMNGASRFQGAPRGPPVMFQQRGPRGAAGAPVMMRARGAVNNNNQRQPRGYIIRQRSPSQPVVRHTSPQKRPASSSTIKVQSIQTIVGGSTGGAVRTIKRVAQVVTAAPPAKIIKLERTTVSASAPSDYASALKQQAALRARVQEQKELRRQQMASQRAREAETALAQSGLSIETVINQQPIPTVTSRQPSHVVRHVTPQVAPRGHVIARQMAPRGGHVMQAPRASHVAGPGLVAGQQPRVPMVARSMVQGDHLVGQRLVRPGAGNLQMVPVRPTSNRTVLAPGSTAQHQGLRTTGVVNISNLSPHTTRHRIVALAGSVGPTKNVAFITSGKSRVEFMNPTDALKFYSRFNRKSLDNFVLQMTLS